MHFTTIDGLEYDIDLQRRELRCSVRDSPIAFDEVTSLYAGSPGICLIVNQCIIYQSAPIKTCDPIPTEGVESESGNVLIITQNSAYEIDQEQKQVRRLAGVNRPTSSIGLDGEWQSYSDILSAEVGRSALLVYSDKSKSPTWTSQIREIRGVLVSPPVDVNYP